MKDSKSLSKAFKFGIGAFSALALVLVSVCRWKSVSNSENSSSKRTACMHNHPSGKSKH